MKYSPLFAGASCVVLLSCATGLHASESAETKHDHEMEQHGSHEHGSARLTMAATKTGLEIFLESPAANLFGFEHQASTDEQQQVIHEAVEKLEAGDALFVVNDEASCQLASVNVESALVAHHDEETGHKHTDKKHDDHDDHDADKKHDDHDDHDADKKHDDHDDHDADKKHDDHDDHDADKKHDDHDDHDADKKHDDHDDHDADKKHDDHDDHGTDKKHDHDDHGADKKHDDHDKHEAGETHSDVEVSWVFECAEPAAIATVETKVFSQFPKGFEELDVEWLTADSAGVVELTDDGTIKFSQ